MPNPNKKPKPVLPNESGQMPAPGATGPKNPARRERRLAKRAANAQKKTATTATDPNRPYVSKGPLVDESKNWALDVLKGNFESNPWLNRMMDPANLDVRNNPNLKPVVDAIQREGGQDLLRNLWQADAQSEQLGRPGSGYSAALRMQREHDTNQSVQDALSRVYAGAYENEANRQAGLIPTVLGTQYQAAQIPIEYGQLDVARGQLGVQRGQLGLARNEFNFSKKMQLAAAQQDALSDYLGILQGIGGLGGTTMESQAGSYQPSMGAWEAALMSGMGSALESYGQQKGQAQP